MYYILSVVVGYVNIQWTIDAKRHDEIDPRVSTYWQKIDLYLLVITGELLK